MDAAATAKSEGESSLGNESNTAVSDNDARCCGYHTPQMTLAVVNTRLFALQPRIDISIHMLLACV